MKYKNKVMILAWLLALLLAACTSQGGVETESTTETPTETAVSEPTTAPTEAAPATEPVSDPLAGSAWVLAGMADGSGMAVTLVPDSTITAEFADGSMGGNAGCNSYFAAYTVDGNNIALEQAGSTMMFCEPQALMDQETAYLAALGSVKQFQLENGQLILLDEGGNAVLTYNAKEAETPVGLTEATWLLTTFIIGGDAATSVVIGTRLTAVFNPDGTISGTAGCNNFSGSYTSDGNNITIGRLASTLMACADEAVMAQETAYLAALQAAATYQITGAALELFAADGIPSLIFNAEPPQTLAGSSWDVLSYNNGNQAVVSVIVGTELTAVFGEDGSLTGSAGCNNYNTTFEATETTITIGPAATTRMFCESPEGTMDQEAQYLAALQSAATYRIDGDMLEMRTADDALAATFQRAGFVDPEIRNFLANASYQLDLAASGTVTLTNGEYREPVAADSASELVVTLTDQVATGTINGQYAVAAVLTADPGGSGTFYYLALFTAGDAGLVNVATTPLGDRVIVNSLNITQNTVVVDMVQAGPDDALCCPTEHVMNVYELQGEELVLLSSTPVEE